MKKKMKNGKKDVVLVGMASPISVGERWFNNIIGKFSGEDVKRKSEVRK